MKARGLDLKSNQREAQQPATYLSTAYLQSTYNIPTFAPTPAFIYIYTYLHLPTYLLIYLVTPTSIFSFAFVSSSISLRFPDFFFCCIYQPFLCRFGFEDAATVEVVRLALHGGASLIASACMLPTHHTCIFPSHLLFII